MSDPEFIDDLCTHDSATSIYTSYLKNFDILCEINKRKQEDANIDAINEFTDQLLAIEKKKRLVSLLKNHC